MAELLEVVGSAVGLAHTGPVFHRKVTLLLR